MSFKKYLRTDIASERIRCESPEIKSENYSESGFPVHSVTLEKDCEDISAGSYITIELGDIWNSPKDEITKAAEAISKILKKLCSPFISKLSPVLTVCLGNRRITSDAVGPLCADKIIVTRHIKTEHPELFKSLGNTESALLAPGVTGDTGIETFELIKMTSDVIKPSCVICIDALASRSIDRLATTVQLSNVGISPGSGIGNNRREISGKTLGVPVVSIGVPTVVHSSTLIAEALERSGMTEITSSLKNVLENEKSYFVTLKEADAAVKTAADIISKAVNLTLVGISEL